MYSLKKKDERKLNSSEERNGVGGKYSFFWRSGGVKIQKRLRYGSNSVITSHKNLGRLASFFKISLVGFQKTCMQHLSFLHSFQVDQNFVVELPEIIWWSVRDYMVVESDFIVLAKN